MSYIRIFLIVIALLQGPGSIIYNFFFWWIFLEASYNKTIIRNGKNKSIFFINTDKNKSMLFISQCFISWTKSLPDQFICLKMPLKFRKMDFNLYFHTFNSSILSHQMLHIRCLHCEYSAKTLLWYWSYFFYISTTFSPVSFAASEGKESKEDYLMKLLFISESGTLFSI